MSYEFARIDLSKTDYNHLVRWEFLTHPDVDKLNSIYREYCKYKKFESVMPIFDSCYTDPMIDVIGYYDNTDLVAFSLIRRYDNHNALCDRFAWDYKNPKLQLGIKTLKTECAIYKQRGFNYLYLEQAQYYKSKLTGLEILGPME